MKLNGKRVFLRFLKNTPHSPLLLLEFCLVTRTAYCKPIRIKLPNFSKGATSRSASWELPKSKAFCGKSCVGAGPWLFATTFLMRLTTHDKLSYMETESRFIFSMFPKGIKYCNQNQQICIYT